MLSARNVVSKRLQTLVTRTVRACSSEAPAPAATATPTVPVPTFTEVKFVKEDVTAVMTELPEFNFYEMKEPMPNPYKGLTMDRSVLYESPEPKLVKPEVSFSKLENGLKIASIDRGGLTASLGLFVSAGSRFETAANFGVSHMVELMAFKSTAHLSHLRTVKTLEQMGASLSSTCKAGREDIVYQVEVMREFMPLVVPLVVGNILFPRLLPWEVKAMHKSVKDARAAMEGDADAMVSELLHKAAFCNNSLGYSPLATDRSMPYFTPETVREFMLDHFSPERMVLVGVNVEHSEFAKWAMRSFADYNAIPMKPRDGSKAMYTGGDMRVDAASPYCHLAIGLESTPWGRAELAPVSLLQTILGGGAAVSTSLGGGSLSRLSTQIVKQNPYVASCSAFNTSYSDAGIFGIYGVVEPSQAKELATSMTGCLAGLTSISEGELASAKSILKASIYRQVDDGATLMKDMGTQLLLTGRYGSADNFASIIDSVTTSEVEAAAKKLLSSKPTVAAFGDTHTVPHYSAIEAALK